MVYKDPYFISQLAKSGEFSNEDLISYNILLDEERINVNSVSEKTEKNSDFTRILKLTLDLCFLIALNYLLTFIVFPAVSLQGRLL